MARNSSVNLNINNRSDGFSITGGDIPRGISVISGDMQFYGGDQIYNGQVLIGNSGDNSFDAGYIYAGSGIVIQSGAGSLIIHSLSTGGGSFTGTPIYNTDTGNFATAFNLFQTGQSLYPRSNPSGYVSNLSGILNAGGSGQIYNGELLIGSSGDNAFIQGSLRAGTGIAVQSGAGSLTINSKTIHGITLGVKETSTIAVGEKGRVIISNSGQLVGWKLISKDTTNLTLDIWKLNAANPSNSNSICGSIKPTLTAQQYNYTGSNGITGWNTAIGPHDIITLEVESNSASTDFTLRLDYVII